MKMEHPLKHIYKNKVINLNLLNVIFLTILSSCSNTKTISFNHFGFDTVLDISISTENQNIDLNGIGNNIKNLINNLNSKFDFYDEESELSKLNQSDGIVNLDQDLFNVLEPCFTQYESLFKNAFSLKLGNVNKIWKENLKENKTPTIEKLQSEKIIFENSGIEHFQDASAEKNGQATYDLGSVAKGYALNQAISLLNESQISNYVLNFGESSIAIGDEEKTINIKNYNLKFKAKNICVTTSSIHEQKYNLGTEENPIYYTHIIDPRKIDDFSSTQPEWEQVIILNNDPFFADACSTAFMNLSETEIEEISNDKNLKYILFKNKELYRHSDGINLYE